MSDAATDPSKGLGIFSTLQSARKPAHFLLATVFVLFVDCILIQFHQPGLMSMALATHPPDASFAVKLILIFVLFSFYASVGLEIAASFMDAVWLTFVWGRVYDFNRWVERLLGIDPDAARGSRRRLGFGYVSPFQLMTAAHTSKDSYLLKLYDEYKREAAEDRKQRNEFAVSALGVMLVLGWNGRLASHGGTLSSEITRYLGGTTWWWMTLAVLLVFYVARFHGDDEERGIYCPTLYDALQTKEKAEREEERRMMRALKSAGE